jgi:hypothetical protein
MHSGFSHYAPFECSGFMHYCLFRASKICSINGARAKSQPRTNNVSNMLNTRKGTKKNVPRTKAACNVAPAPMLCESQPSCSILVANDLQCNERPRCMRTCAPVYNQECYCKDLGGTCGLHDYSDSMRGVDDHGPTRR